MAETEQVVSIASRKLPDQIVVASQMTPNEMRALKRITGQPLTELLGGDAEDMEKAPDRLQALAWVALRRAGYDPSWDQAGDVAAVTAEPEPDPTPTDS